MTIGDCFAKKSQFIRPGLFTASEVPISRGFLAWSVFADFAHVIHEPDEERDGGEKEEEGGERQVARPHHVQRFPVRAQRESQRGYWTLDTSSLYLSL